MSAPRPFGMSLGFFMVSVAFWLAVLAVCVVSWTAREGGDRCTSYHNADVGPACDSPR